MSKLKLLLLGGIFSLIGIFNFSNAGDLTITSNGSDYSPSTIYIESVDNLLESYEIQLGEPLNGSQCGIFFDDGTNSCYYQNDGMTSCGRSMPSGNYEIVDGGMGYCSSITISSSFFSDGQIIPGGIDNFTPAINGLHETVKQLIPLVVYLGIGILVVILGFIAIRWLVNWMSNGIKSKFTSKRG